MSPDNRNMDLFLVARPNAHRVPLDLFYDYRTNPAPHSRLRPQLGGEELPEITSRRSPTLLTGERECTRERKEEAMGTVSRGFKGRRPCAKLPPGQYLVEDSRSCRRDRRQASTSRPGLPVTRFRPSGRADLPTRVSRTPSSRSWPRGVKEHV